MKPSQLPFPLFSLLTVGICATAFFAGFRTSPWLFPGGSSPAATQAAPAVVAVPIVNLPQPTHPNSVQENTLFILLGNMDSNTRTTVWYISSLPGSPVFMRLLVPSVQFGEPFDQAFYDLNIQLMMDGDKRQAIEDIFARYQLNWNRILIMDLSMLSAALTSINAESQGRFTIDPAQVAAPLPRHADETRSRPQVVADQVALWNGLCPLFLSIPAEQATFIFRPQPSYPVCIVSDDIH